MARRSGHDEVSIAAGIRLIYTLSVGLGEFDQAAIWIDHTLAEAERVGQDELTSEVYAGIGIHHFAVALSNYATVHGARRSSCSSGPLQINVRALGEQHPMTGLVELNLSSNLVELDDADALARALSLAERSLVVHREVFGEDHGMVGQSQRAIAVALLHQGRPHEALAPAQAAIEVWTRNFGPAHDDTNSAELVLAQCELALARIPEARARLERILGYEFEDTKVRATAQLELAAVIIDEDPERAANLLSLVKPYVEDIGDDRSIQRIITLERELRAR